jgi:hypothetical protein
MAGAARAGRATLRGVRKDVERKGSGRRDVPTLRGAATAAELKRWREIERGTPVVLYWKDAEGEGDHWISVSDIDLKLPIVRTVAQFWAITEDALITVADHIASDDPQVHGVGRYPLSTVVSVEPLAPVE